MHHVNLQPGAVMRTKTNHQNSRKASLFFFSFLIASLSSLVFVSCGSDDSKEEKGIPQTAEEMAQQASANLGSKTDMDAFILDYQKFADEYCAEGKGFKSAGLMEKVQLAQNMTGFATKMSEYNAQILSLQASASESVQQRIEEIGKQLDGCQKYWDME